ncbi:hypothetical protein [Candidatus Uabimicrobium amorphum]|uniref:Uncharacterized protein n=1 Tax=Uabimicrobium amorphum TaxID=2596890 RepID=A0A5S9IQ11_UABAM|nr:hypothetical protein [Candidatus Uabimicrobium amorphum]BBM85516.1 hypothetical protein UABAM_03885 [Candidatus Uabimicrobium amorphum]
MKPQRILILLSLVVLINIYSLEMVPLRLCWSDKHKDHYSFASKNIIKIPGYVFLRTQGFILKKPMQTTVALRLYYSSKNNDYFCAASEKVKKIPGYKYLGLQGYIYKTKKVGTVPLKLYWSNSRKEYFNVVTIKEQKVATKKKYKLIATQGYVYKNNKLPQSMVLSQGGSAHLFASDSWNITLYTSRSSKDFILYWQSKNGIKVKDLRTPMFQKHKNKWRTVVSFTKADAANMKSVMDKTHINYSCQVWLVGMYNKNAKSNKITIQFRKRRFIPPPTRKIHINFTQAVITTDAEIGSGDWYILIKVDGQNLGVSEGEADSKETVLLNKKVTKTITDKTIIKIECVAWEKDGMGAPFITKEGYVKGADFVGQKTFYLSKQNNWDITSTKPYVYVGGNDEGGMKIFYTVYEK